MHKAIQIKVNKFTKETHQFIHVTDKNITHEELKKKAEDALGITDFDNKFGGNYIEIVDRTDLQIPEDHSQKWLSLEFLIREYEEQYQNETDEDYRQSIYYDLNDLKKLLNKLITKDFTQAYKFYQELDTAVRERVPDDIKQFFHFYMYYKNVLY